MINALTPRYRDIKKQYPDCLILFECGETYLALEKDAETLSKELEIDLCLLSDLNSVDSQWYSEFPEYYLSSYLKRLIVSGNKVLISCNKLLVNGI